MSFEPAALYASPNALAPHYSRFGVADRLLLTGHSHQAWPDAGFEGQQRAWLDAAELVDGKWERAFAVAEQVKLGYARLLDVPPGELALGQNTFELVSRLLSALPLAQRPRLVTTDGEFHTIRRLLDRLEEEGLEIVRVPAAPADAVAERLCAAADGRTAAVLVSSVLYLNAHIVPGLGDVAAACARHGAELLVDAYHHLNVVPFSAAGLGLEAAFITGGGYKYCQLGEGNAFLRVPPGRRLRPVLTGWYAEFAALAERSAAGRAAYGGGADAFAGATYDPTSHYRAAAVFDFFAAHRLTPDFLRGISRHQVARMSQRFDGVGADPRLVDRDRSVGQDGVGGFLALRSPRAAELSSALHERGVMTDHRADVLRLGPAPYLSDAQLDAAVDALGDAVRAMGSTPAGLTPAGEADART